MAASSLAQGAAPGGERADRSVLFPRPLLVEHSVVHRDPQGGEVRSLPVTDVYAGSFLVSERTDGSKVIVDLAGRQVTATNPSAGTYWTVSFDRLARLRERAVELERLPSSARGAEDGPEEGAEDGAGGGAGRTAGAEQERRAGSVGASAGSGDAAAGSAGTGEAESELVVEELAVRAAAATATESEVDRAAAAVTARPGVRRLRVVDRRSVEATGADAELEAWVDPSVTMSARAIAALAAFERDALGGEPGGAAARLDVARRFAGGALPVRTRRALVAPGAGLGGEPGGGVATSSTSLTSPAVPTLEDAASRVEWLDAVPPGLLEVPAGLVRVPHPLEMIVAAGERERALLGGRP